MDYIYFTGSTNCIGPTQTNPKGKFDILWKQIEKKVNPFGKKTEPHPKEELHLKRDVRNAEDMHFWTIDYAAIVT